MIFPEGLPQKKDDVISPPIPRTIHHPVRTRREEIGFRTDFETVVVSPGIDEGVLP